MIALSTPEPLLERLVTIDTQNPPGAEVQAAEVLKGVLAEIGFEAVTDDVTLPRFRLVSTFRVLRHRRKA